jgi:hypothetical protein
MEEMKIMEYGLVNAMNSFSRRMVNLIEEQIKNDGKLLSASYSMPEVDFTMYSMFKIYQKIQ